MPVTPIPVPIVHIIAVVVSIVSAVSVMLYSIVGTLPTAWAGPVGVAAALLAQAAIALKVLDSQDKRKIAAIHVAAYAPGGSGVLAVDPNDDDVAAELGR